MEESLIDHNVTVPAHDQAARIAQPRERSLYFIATLIPPHFASIVIFTFLVIAAIGTNQLDPAFGQSFPQRIAVIASVSDESIRIFPRPTAAFARYSNAFDRSFQERYFRRGRTVQVVSQRNTLAVDHHHPLRALAPLGLADAVAPFFAGAKLPSINDSDQSNWPFSSNSARKARQMVSHTSCSSQSRSRLQHVDGLGYSLGKSAHGVPVRRIHRMPSRTFRVSAQGRPPFLDFLGFGSKGSIFFHCLSVSFQRSFAIEKSPFDSKCDISRLLAQAYNLQIVRL
jgi:hypothetical protein